MAAATVMERGSARATRSANAAVVSCVILVVITCVDISGAVLVKPSVPPRGWNSYDAWGASNESITLATAEGMARGKLGAAGYNLVTIDAGWFGDNVVIDEYGRPIPDRKIYPSAGAEGTFKPLADKIHAMNQKFGVWYMAGVPAASYNANSPIKGTTYTVRDIATNATYCPRWDKGWGWEVDHTHPAAQAWYDSLVELWSGWGADLIKLDCVNAEDEAAAHRLDIVRISSAMQAAPTGFIFSLSPGGFANISQMHEVGEHVSMARATDDFWDNWAFYMDSGGGGGASSGFSHWDASRDLAAAIRSTAPTFWIDLDMLPLGRIGHAGGGCGPVGVGCPRQGRYTFDETRSILTLWGLVRSPLILGGDARAGALPSDVEDALAHPGLIAMTEGIRFAAEATRVNRTDGEHGYVVWHATSTAGNGGGGGGGGGDGYVAVFNLVNASRSYRVCWVSAGVARAPAVGAVEDVWAGKPFAHADADGFDASVAAHGVLLLKLGSA